MKALHVLFLIALISCVQFNFQNKIFINDVNENVKFETCGSTEFIEITDYSPKQINRNDHVDAIVTFKAKKQVSLKKMVIRVQYSFLDLSFDYDIGKSLSEGDTYTYKNSEYSVPWYVIGEATLTLKLVNDNNDEIYCARFICDIMSIVNAQLSYTTCGSTDYLEITDYSPKEINPGDSIVGKITVKAKQDLEATKVHYEVQYIGITLLSGDIDVQVSLTSGQTYSQEQSGDVPSIIPPGQYNIIAKAYNSEGTELYCANFQIIF